MTQRKPAPSFEATPAEQALTLRWVGEMDLLRLKCIARLQARGLPPEVHWSDLLQEAFRRVLDGSRRRPPDVPMVAFLGGVMRSIRSEVWKQTQRTSMRLQSLQAQQAEHELLLGRSAERTVLAHEQLAEIERLFASDPIALQIIRALAEGLAAQEVRTACDLSKKKASWRRPATRRSKQWHASWEWNCP
jgi:RNA polymerase sigma-70 factor (ECF subfamily)